MPLRYYLQQTNAAALTVLVRLMVGLAVFFPEGLQRLMFADLLQFTSHRSTNLGLTTRRSSW